MSRPPSPVQVIALVGIGASEHVARSAAPVWRDAGPARVRRLGLRAAARRRRRSPTSTSGSASPDAARRPSPRCPRARPVAGGRRHQRRRVAARRRRRRRARASTADRTAPSTPPATPPPCRRSACWGSTGPVTRTDWAGLPGAGREVLERPSRSSPRRWPTPSTPPASSTWWPPAPRAPAAGEGALMLRESARLHTACHETYNYLHGPMEPLDARTACLVIGDGREVRLAAGHQRAGLSRPCWSPAATDVPSAAGLTVLRLPRGAVAAGLAVLQILPIQLLGWRSPAGGAWPSTASGTTKTTRSWTEPVTRSVSVIGNVQLDVLASPVDRDAAARAGTPSSTASPCAPPAPPGTSRSRWPRWASTPPVRRGRGRRRRPLGRRRARAPGAGGRPARGRRAGDRHLDRARGAPAASGRSSPHTAS